MTFRRPITVEISPGELIDKLTILAIKRERIDDPTKLAHIQAEFDLLTAARDKALDRSDLLDQLTEDLLRVNLTLWQVEDEIRQCDQGGDFGPRFVELARSVYRHNDRRAALKRQINEHLGSRFIEEKSYPSYDDL